MIFVPFRFYPYYLAMARMHAACVQYVHSLLPGVQICEYCGAFVIARVCYGILFLSPHIFA